MSAGPRLAAVRELAESVLLPAAAAVDRGQRPFAAHLPALADLGLFGMVVPTDAGGLGLGPPEIRAILRLLGSGCGVTAFAFAQHHGTTAAVAATDNAALRDRWLPALRRDVLAGIAYAHVRRQGPPVLTAEPDGDGWILNGTAPWVTSWGTAEVFGVAAMTADGRMVWSLVPGRTGPGLTVASVFELMVFGATDTVALTFDRYRVDPDCVLSVIDAERWREGDRFMAARPNPLCLGVGDRALVELGGVDRQAADALTPWWANLTDRAEQQSSAVDRRGTDPDGAVLADVAAMRAESLTGVQRLTTALLAAAGGRAMEAGHPAQRLSREGLFYVIQAQSGDGRRATLERLTGLD